MPKARLLADGGLDFEYALAERLHKTHKQLIRDLGQGEIAWWRAKTEIDNERYDRAVKKAQEETQSKRKAARARR